MKRSTLKVISIALAFCGSALGHHMGIDMGSVLALSVIFGTSGILLAAAYL